MKFKEIILIFLVSGIITLLVKFAFQGKSESEGSSQLLAASEPDQLPADTLLMIEETDEEVIPESMSDDKKTADILIEDPEAFKRAQGPAVFVSPELDALYLSVENQVVIEYVGGDDVSAAVNQGICRASGKGKNSKFFTVFPKKLGPLEMTIGLFKDGKFVGTATKRLVAERVPSPKPAFKWKKYLGNKYPLKRAEFKNLKLDVEMDSKIALIRNCPKFYIFCFTIRANVNGAEKTAEAFGDALSAEQLEIVSSVKAGEKIHFEKIKAKFSDGSVRELAPMWLQVE